MSDADRLAEETRAFWDKRYAAAEPGGAFGDQPNVFLAAQAHLFQPGMRALVPGDGQGRNGVWLAQQGLVVDTLDISPVGVERARTLAAASGLRVNAQLADLLAWDWPEAAYDVIASIYVHFFDVDRPRVHRAMLSALKPGGALILEAFNPGQLELQKTEGSGGPKTADMLFSADKLRADFADACIELLEERIVDLAEGHRHKGRGAVVRLIARRC
ncbi:MAG: class I SAM-dependent methyltransferase [Hyphomicrobiales bacterium]|nr:class I SAM-dependent methyltransferase [Hyphomicrobiales bacterium]